MFDLGSQKAPLPNFKTKHSEVKKRKISRGTLVKARSPRLGLGKVRPADTLCLARVVVFLSQSSYISR